MPKGSFVYDRWVMLGLTVFSYQGLSFCDNFGIYSAQVKQQYGFSQDQLDSIATAGFWPNLVGAAPTSPARVVDALRWAHVHTVNIAFGYA